MTECSAPLPFSACATTIPSTRGDAGKLRRLVGGRLPLTTSIVRGLIDRRCDDRAVGNHVRTRAVVRRAAMPPPWQLGVPAHPFIGGGLIIIYAPLADILASALYPLHRQIGWIILSGY